jgi:predicted nuclease of restriction endonuclease-like RecB superfamily
MVVDAFEQLVVRLPAQEYRTTDFNMNEARRELLIEAGRAAMRDYLTRRPENLAKAASLEELIAEEARMQQAANKIALKLLF